MQRLSIFIYLAFFFLLGCEKDEIRATLNADGLPAVITNTSDELSLVITNETLQEDVSFEWNETEYGVNTEVSYTLEIDAACNNFASPIVIGATTDHVLDLTQEALNTKLLNDLKLAQHVPADLQIRVTSKVNGGFLKTSEPVTFTITPYSAWAKGLWLLGDDWTDATAPVIYAKSASVYDGYVYLNKDQAFKFADNRICEKTLFGGAEGSLSSETSAAELSVGTTGYYRVVVDVENSTYEFTYIETFGMIGTSTPGGWSTSSALTYNEGAQSWEGNIDLTAGALKFRANNGWSINYGPADGNVLAGKLLLDDPGSISIQESGNYTVVIDFSKKKSPDFTYTVTKNAADQVPATLWLPGEYQGWSPSTAPTIKAINSSTFDGYVYISSPTGYKFTDAPDWNHTNYGDSGTPGVLTTDGAAGGLGLSQAGVYKFNVNVNTLAYSAVLINSMGMVGPATLNGSNDGWNQSVAMSYNQANDVWSATINLAPGALKFRANNEWTINYGPADGNSLTGTLIFDDPGSISITEAGSYTVTVDFSRSEAPYKYTYSIVKN